MRVVRVGHWRRFQPNFASNGGYRFQITECEHDGRRFFVRENLQCETFVSSNSGVKLARKQGRTAAGENVLELACAPGHYAELSRLVHEADSLHRRVRRNRTFTLNTAKI